MNDPKVSVIVPCYNVEKLLPKCLDSLVNQTLTDIEIICVNDASPDNGIAILRDYEARYPNIRVIDLKKNVCLGGARNRGMEIARGEYIAFVDSDDYVEPDMYEKLYTRAQATGADVVTCDFNTVDENYKLLAHHINPRKYLCGEINNDQLKEKLLVSMSMPWNRIQKRGLIEHNGLKFPEHIFFEDLYFNVVEALFVQHMEYVPECLYNFYQNQKSITRDPNNITRRISDRNKSRQMTLDYYREKGLFERYPNALRYIIESTSLQNLGLYIGAFGADISFLRGIRQDLITAPTKQRNPFFRNLFTKKQKTTLFMIRSCPRLYLSIWKAKRLLKKLIK